VFEQKRSSSVPLGADTHAHALGRAQDLDREQEERKAKREAFLAANPGQPVPAEMQEIYIPSMLERTGPPPAHTEAERTNASDTARDEFGHIEERVRGIQQWDGKAMTDDIARTDTKSGLGYSVSESLLTNDELAVPNQERTMQRTKLNDSATVIHQSPAGAETEVGRAQQVPAPGGGTQTRMAVTAPATTPLGQHFHDRVTP
jgi:hypothetical protein